MTDILQLESLLDSISGGFFALNDQYEIIYWNRAAEQGTGLKAKEVLGKNVFDVFPNASGATLGEKYRLAMDTRTFQSFETAYKDERFEAWYDVRIYPSDTGISVFFQDVTEKKREQRHKEILAEISKTINQSRHLDELCILVAEKVSVLFEIPSKFVCVFLYDPRGNEIRLVTPAFIDCEFPEDCVHQRVEPNARHQPARAGASRETLITDRILESTVAGMFHEEMTKSNLKTLIVLPLCVQGELQGVLEVPSIKEKDFVASELEVLSVIANELAGGMSRKRLMDELRTKNLELEAQTQKALDAGDTLKKFLATFSHELRSPLNSIIGFSELMMCQLASLPPESVQEFTQNIHTSGRHLQQIINDILDLSKIEAGKLDLHIASYPVSYFKESIERLLSAAVKEKSIALEFRFSPEFDEIVVDQTRFKQILINLVANAIKFSHPRGTVRISSARIGNDIQFEVKDEGIGIKPEELQVLFKPFRQAASGREINHQGMGLGLAITKKLVELHGGTVWIESDWGKGTSVFFKIPMIVDATSENVLQAGMLLDALQRENYTKDPQVKPLALVVEDSPQASELLKMYIESAGYSVEVARNGEEALDVAKRLHPNVITLDLMLPIKELHRQAAAGGRARAVSQARSRGARAAGRLPPLRAEPGHSARRHRPRRLHREKIRRARLQRSRPAGARRSAVGNPLRVRQDRAPAEHARRACADRAGAPARRAAGGEGGADESVFCRRPGSHRHGDAGTRRGGGRARSRRGRCLRRRRGAAAHGGRRGRQGAPHGRAGRPLLHLQQPSRGRGGAARRRAARRDAGSRKGTLAVCGRVTPLS